MCGIKEYEKRDGEKNDDITLIALPRRFGKTITMDMMNCFFSLSKFLSGISDGFSGCMADLPGKNYNPEQIHCCGIGFRGKQAVIV